MATVQPSGGVEEAPDSGKKSRVLKRDPTPVQVEPRHGITEPQSPAALNPAPIPWVVAGVLIPYIASFVVLVFRLASGATTTWPEFALMSLHVTCAAVVLVAYLGRSTRVAGVQTKRKDD